MVTLRLLDMLLCLSLVDGWEEIEEFVVVVIIGPDGPLVWELSYKFESRNILRRRFVDFELRFYEGCLVLT